MVSFQENYITLWTLYLGVERKIPLESNSRHIIELTGLSTSVRI